MLRQAFGGLAIAVVLALPNSGHAASRMTAEDRIVVTRVKTEKSAASRHMTCSKYPCTAGFYWVPFIDPECPDSQDSLEMYVEYWYSDESFAYDVDTSGHSTYYCGSQYKTDTAGSSWEYVNCTNNSPWNCQQLQ